jgi:hypothetical protein
MSHFAFERAEFWSFRADAISAQLFLQFSFSTSYRFIVGGFHTASFGFSFWCRKYRTSKEFEKSLIDLRINGDDQLEDIEECKQQFAEFAKLRKKIGIWTVSTHDFTGDKFINGWFCPARSSLMISSFQKLTGMRCDDFVVSLVTKMIGDYRFQCHGLNPVATSRGYLTSWSFSSDVQTATAICTSSQFQKVSLHSLSDSRLFDANPGGLTFWPNSDLPIHRYHFFESRRYINQSKS